MGFWITYTATLEIDHEMLNKVKTRKIAAIKPSDLVVINSKVSTHSNSYCSYYDTYIAAYGEV